MKKCISLKELYENKISYLTLGGHIVATEEDGNYFDLVNHQGEILLCDGEELDFGEWFTDNGQEYIVGATENGKKIYFSKEEYNLAIFEAEETKFGIILKEKPEIEGLTKAETMQMFDALNGEEVYPLEISGTESSAMGFITKETARILDYDYEESGLEDFITLILNDMDRESADGCYTFREIKIYMDR